MANEEKQSVPVFRMQAHIDGTLVAHCSASDIGDAVLVITEIHADEYALEDIRQVIEEMAGAIFAMLSEVEDGDYSMRSTVFRGSETRSPEHPF